MRTPQAIDVLLTTAENLKANMAGCFAIHVRIVQLAAF
jgi:hypothetical protein